MADEPSKTDRMATQINTVMERLNELVDRTLAHHHTQFECTIESASKTFSIKADKIINKLSDHVELMGDCVVQSEIQHHKDVLDDVTHISFHIVQTQALVGVLHKHAQKAMVLVAAGFHALAEDNKTRDRQFKACFDFTECTTILLIQLEMFVRNELKQVQHTISKNVNHQVAHSCKQQESLVNIIHGHAHRVLEGYKRIIKRQDGLLNQIECQLDKRFGPVGCQCEQTDNIFTRTYHNMHSVCLDLANLTHEVYGAVSRAH
jgi:frataxin-like iron-binding protein CyaY